MLEFSMTVMLQRLQSAAAAAWHCPLHGTKMFAWIDAGLQQQHWPVPPLMASLDFLVWNASPGLYVGNGRSAWDGLLSFKAARQGCMNSTNEWNGVQLTIENAAGIDLIVCSSPLL